MILRSLILCLLCLSANAATYYVRTDGNDGNTGTADTAGGAWRNIGMGITNAVGGDTVNVRAGTYREFLTNSVSGSAGNPITFIGERGAGGEWLTIIEPSTALASGWVAAPEVGSGVYKHTACPFTTHELTIAGKHVGFVWTVDDMSSDISACYTASGMTKGSNILNQASAATVQIEAGKTINFWDGIEALWTATLTTTYLKLRDGSDPNGLDIRIAPNTGSDGTERDLYYATPNWAAIKSSSAGYIVWKNFLIRGAVGGFYLYGASPSNWTIQSNYLSGGMFRIVLEAGPEKNAILGNTFTSGFYGSTNSGAWSGGASVPQLTFQHHYKLSKFLEGNSSTVDYDIYFRTAGQSNVITGNTFGPGIGGSIGINGNTASPTAGTEISSNVFNSFASLAIYTDSGETQTHIFGNQVRNSNIFVRGGTMDDASETDRTVYVYRNRIYNTNYVGEAFYFHFDSSVTGPYLPVYWVYFNSFSGGTYVVEDQNSDCGLGGLRVVNNLLSYHYQTVSGSNPLKNDTTYFGGFDYNLIAAASSIDSPAPVWWGANNIAQTPAEWPNSSLTSFVLVPGSAAINAGLNLAATFTLKGTNYSALPDNGTVKVGPQWDIGALEYQPLVTTLRNLRVFNAVIR